MPRVKLTERFISSIPLPRSHHALYWDTEVRGLTVRITQNGSRYFVFCYAFDGQDQRYSLARWSPLTSNKLGTEATRNLAGTLAWARQEVQRLRAEVVRGNNPQQQKKEARTAREGVEQQSARDMTVAKLAEKYLNVHAVHKRSGKEDERRLNSFIVPAWGTRKAKGISRADVDELVTPVATGGKGSPARPAEARQRLALVRKMFSFAVDKGIIDQHPCLRMTAPGGKINARTRALTTAKELRLLWGITDPDRIWTRMPKAGKSKTNIRNQRFLQGEAEALRMVLLTGARASEVTDLPWSELDLEAATWLLPAERSKNNRPHLVPLVPQLVDLLRKRRSAVRGDWVFPAKQGGHITAGHLQRPLRLVCARLARLGLASFTTHDLRRTVETGMAAAKVAKEYRDRVLNHVDSSVGGVHYNMHDYEDEKREALEKWARRLEGMLTGSESNVVPMRRAG